MTKNIKNWLFRLGVIALPFILIIFFEWSLRITQFGADLKLFVPYTDNPDFLIHNPDVSLRFFSRRGQTGFGGDDVFKREKGTKTLRIFVLGGSTTAGFPFFFNARFSSQIKVRLQDAYPGYNVEIVNLGMTAINSYTVRDFARECLQYDPDLLLIYAGHNEFYGAYGSASTQKTLFGTNRTLTLAVLQLKKLKLYQLVRSLISSLQSIAMEKEGDSRTLMARMVGESTIPWGGDLYNQTMAIFKDNIEDIIHWTNAIDVPILFGTLVSNIKDQKPFVSIHENDVDEVSFDKQIIDIKEQMLEKEYKHALDQLQKLMEQSPHYALLYFYAGRCAQLLGDYEMAKDYYIKARDFDGLRFRASSDINRIIAGFTHQLDHVYLAEIDSAFAANSPHNLIGNELMLEHLHPTIEGYFLMGKVFAETIINENLFDKIGQRHTKRSTTTKTDDHYRRQIAITPLDLRIAEYQMETLLSGWPFIPNQQNKTLSDFKPASKLEEIALNTLKKKLNFWEAHLAMVDYYLESQRGDDALQEANALVAAFPHNFKSYKILGKTLLELEKHDRALSAFMIVIELQEDAFSYKWVGTILLNKGQHKEAIPYLEKALILNPEDHQALYNLSGAYHLVGHREKAIETLEKLIHDEPGFPNGQVLKVL